MCYNAATIINNNTSNNTMITNTGSGNQKQNNILFESFDNLIRGAV